MDRGADEAAMDEVGSADRSAVRLRRRVRLLAVHGPRLVEQIGIGRDRVIAGLAAIGVGMNRDIAAAASSRMPPSTPRSTELTAVRVSTLVHDEDCASTSGALAGMP